MIRIIDVADDAALARLFEPRPNRDDVLERRVASIVRLVRQQGDRAVARFARRLDGWRGPLEIPRAEIQAQARLIAPAVRRALETAGRHIRTVSARQLPRPFSVEVRPGLVVETRVTPLERIGCYVPGGRYPLPSSLLMTAIPARVAGVAEIVAACPRPSPVVMAAATIVGVDRFFRIGGAHAIAALAYGTETVPRVDKIAGPGNRYVTSAKTLVSRDCAIDLHAGPTEIVVLASRGNPRWIAADLLAQAEHDPDARAILVTTSRKLAEEVARALAEMAQEAGIAAGALSRHGAIVVTKDIREAARTVNRLAPEHVACLDDRTARLVTRAGTVFVGPFSVPAAGDYATGSNHVLPTAGAARFRGGLSAADFVRVTSAQRLTRGALQKLLPTVVELARAEGLEAHAQSVLVRFQKEKGKRKKEKGSFTRLPAVCLPAIAFCPFPFPFFLFPFPS